MLNEAKIRKEQITKAFEEGTKSSFRGGGGVVNRAYEENERTQGYSNSELIQQHRSAIEEQDQGLSRISEIVKRQKQIGLAMGDEIDGQNDSRPEISPRWNITMLSLLSLLFFLVPVFQPSLVLLCSNLIFF
eukprot:sb/3474952/